MNIKTEPLKIIALHPVQNVVQFLGCINILCLLSLSKYLFKKIILSNIFYVKQF